jgi:release factor glutamine methyltransferase
MKITAFRTYFIEQVAPYFDAEEATSFFYLLIEQRRNLKRVDLVMQPDLFLTESELAEFQFVISELQRHKPIQYILGSTEFYGLQFDVNEHTLIPRPETEELVEWVVLTQKSIVENLESEAATIDLLDIGTGSGCIAISLAKNMRYTQVAAIDVSVEALATAQKNAGTHKVAVEFICKNILEATVLTQKYHVIVSNPPYIRMLEKQEIKPNVLDFEPHLALFVANEDPLLFYRKIAQLAQKHLHEKGYLFFEINQYLAKETLNLLEDIGFKSIELRKDIYGNDRMIRCQV